MVQKANMQGQSAGLGCKADKVQCNESMNHIQTILGWMEMKGHDYNILSQTSIHDHA